MDREQQLKKIFNEKGGLLDCQTILHNPYYQLFEFDGVNLCSVVTDGGIYFSIVDCYEKNACAVYDLRTIVVFKGMMNAIFSISARIVDVGFFPGVGFIEARQARVDPRKLLLTKRELLQSLPEFAFDSSEFPWVESEERLGLFLFISNIIFRFVVFHELGHFYNDHGKRNLGKHFFDIDEMEADSAKGDLAAQARETVADTFAFQKLVEYMKLHLDSMSGDPLELILRTHVVKDDEDLVAFTAQLIFVYFHMMELPDWATIEPHQWRHPPAPFRLRSILAALLEHGVINVPPERIPILIEKAMVMGSNMVAQMFGSFPDFGWLQVLDRKKYTDHYGVVFEEIPKWVATDDDRWPRF